MPHEFHYVLSQLVSTMTDDMGHLRTSFHVMMEGGRREDQSGYVEMVSQCKLNRQANGGTLSDSYDDEPQILVTNSWSGVRLCPERGTVLLARSIGNCLASCCYRVIFRPQGTSSFLEPIDARWIVDLGFLRRWQTTGVKPPRPFFW
jgi:hypothetical protein